MAIVLVEQYYDFAEALADRFVVHRARRSCRRWCRIRDVVPRYPTAGGYLKPITRFAAEVVNALAQKANGNGYSQYFGHTALV